MAREILRYWDPNPIDDDPGPAHSIEHDVESVFSDVVDVFSGECPVTGGPVTSMETGGTVVLCADASR